MSFFACLSCKKPFVTASELIEYKESRHNPVIVTKCGHLYHLTCLEGAFVYQKFKFEANNLPVKKWCPYSHCKADLSDSEVLRIHPVQVDIEEIDEEADAIQILRFQQKQLELKNINLQKEIEALIQEKINSIVKGDKVYWQSKEGIYNPATVLDLQAKIKLEPVDTNNNKNNRLSTTEVVLSKFYQLRFMVEQSVSMSDIMSEKDYCKIMPSCQSSTKRDSIISNSPNSSVPTSPEVSPPAYVYVPPPHNKDHSKMKPKWNAGDRIFIPHEKEYATIKWIGHREHQLIAGVEYDRAVGDDSLDTVDTPLNYKPGHGRKFSVDELSKIAVKQEDQSKNPFGFGRLRFGSGRGSNLTRSSTFYVDQPPKVPPRGKPTRSMSLVGSQISRNCEALVAATAATAFASTISGMTMTSTDINNSSQSSSNAVETSTVNIDRTSSQSAQEEQSSISNSIEQRGSDVRLKY